MIATTDTLWPPELTDVIARGAAQIRRDQEERERRAAEQAAAEQAEIDAERAKLEADAQALLPGFLHPYMDLERGGNGQRPLKKSHTVRFRIPGLSDITVHLSRPWGTVDGRGDYAQDHIVEPGWRVGRYNLILADGCYYDRNTVERDKAVTYEDLPVALAKAAEWEQTRLELQAKADRLNAELEAQEADRRAALQALEKGTGEPPALPKRPWEQALERLDAQVDTMYAKEADVALLFGLSAVATGLKALVLALVETGHAREW